MDSLTIRRKLFLVFGVLLAIFLASSLYAGYSLNSINSGALRIATEHLGSVMTAMESSQSLANYRQGEFSVVTAKSLPARLYAARDNKNCAAQIDIALDALAPAVAPEVKDDLMPCAGIGMPTRLIQPRLQIWQRLAGQMRPRHCWMPQSAGISIFLPSWTESWTAARTLSSRRA